MALKKSELYSSLWSSCDELRGGMDASQYKDYVLVLLFVKYVSDKYAGQTYAPISIPKGASFADMVALKGKTDIGDQINKKILGPLAQANNLSDMLDFNDPNKLGSGKEMIELPLGDGRIETTYETEYSFFIPGDPHEALLMVFLTGNDRNMLRTEFLRQSKTPPSSK